MSLVLSQVARIDAQLDRIQLSSIRPPAASSAPTTALESAIKALSLDPSSPRLLSAQAIASHLAPLAAPSSNSDLEWLLVSKATTQTYGLVIDRLLSSTLRVADETAYWESVLRTWRATALYGAQTAPWRFAAWAQAVLADVRERTAALDVQGTREDVAQQWQRFYGLVRDAVRDRNVKDVSRSVVRPVARLRSEIRSKQTELRRARLRGANALGVLLGEGLMNESVHGDGLATPAADDAGRRWKVSVARNVALMDAVLVKVNLPGLEVDKFDAAIAEETDEDALFSADVMAVDAEGISPGAVAERLGRLIEHSLLAFDESSKAITTEHGRPSRLVRYWLPVTVGILSSSTVLRILVSRKAEIATWLEEFGRTVIDFWSNWVVEPTRKVIQTIRHDEGSEVSIMSKRSLAGDRESLERMVVEFARDNPGDATASGHPMNEVELADLRAKVREGDLTPVLKAYEKDMVSPFVGAVRGNLIRALLIQVQKTKVDIEVAMGGIDALLKSQELVFGFIGLTPGILVTVAFWQWFRATLSSDAGLNRQRKHGVMVRQLRNIDRVLANSTPTDFGELFYKDHGLLLCEVHVLRQEAKRSMPDQVYREFMEEMEELVDVRTGVKRQKSVVERVRWAYARWF